MVAQQQENAEFELADLEQFYRSVSVSVSGPPECAAGLSTALPPARCAVLWAQIDGVELEADVDVRPWRRQPRVKARDITSSTGRRMEAATFRNTIDSVLESDWLPSRRRPRMLGGAK